MSTSNSNYKYFPINFNTIYSLAGIITNESYANGGCFVIKYDTSKFISGIGQDFQSATDETICIYALGK